MMFNRHRVECLIASFDVRKIKKKTTSLDRDTISRKKWASIDHKRMISIRQPLNFEIRHYNKLYRMESYFSVNCIFFLYVNVIMLSDTIIALKWFFYFCEGSHFAGNFIGFFRFLLWTFNWQVFLRWYHKRSI
jgi:hypothetical protein